MRGITLQYIRNYMPDQIWQWLQNFWIDDNPTDRVAGQVRCEQIRAITRLTPIMMLANCINAVLTIYSLWGYGHDLFLFIWAAIIPAAIFVGIRGYLNLDRFKDIKEVSIRAPRKAVRNAAVLGAVWGILPVVTFPGAEPHQQILLACLMAGMLCGAGFALSAIPLAAIVATSLIAFGSLTALIMTGSITLTIVAGLLLLYSGTIVYASVAHGRLFESRIRSSLEIEHQNQIIGLLLRDFEESASDWLWETDANLKLQHVSHRFAEAFSSEECILREMTLTDLFEVQVGGNDEGQCTVATLGETLNAQRPFRDLVLKSTINGEERWFLLTGKPIIDPDGKFVGYRGVGSDVTAQVRAEARIAQLAHFDPLTNLANRARFCDQANGALERLERHGDRFAVLLIDLDKFKAVNDTRGHPFGDQLLVAVASRLSQCASDTDVVARLGGDEFAILQRCENQPENAGSLAHRVISAFKEPFLIEDVKVSIDVSIGVSVAPNDGTKVATLLKNADLALYRAKEDYFGSARFFEREMDERQRERRELEFDLRTGLAEQQFHLYFQPIIDVAANNVCGFEALIRWQHPTRGLIQPTDFVPIAEEGGLITEIGEWVVREACACAALWPDDLTVSVNLSPAQFGNRGIQNIVKDALKQAGLEPNRLIVEITEGILINNTEVVLKELQELKDLGVSIAMDDFGTGYSSLSYLWRFPFDKLKIDRSFVSALGHEETVDDILRTILSLGKTLQMSVIAEGVETNGQVEFLQKELCDQLQGFKFGHPMPASELPEWLLRRFDDQLHHVEQESRERVI